MYSLYDYGWMIAGTARTDAYTEALRQTIKPDSVVLDIGTGTGLWALLACKFGARKVYAVEPDNVIEVARETAELNGFAHRIQFIQKLSTQIELSEQAQVIVSDVRGVLPVFGTGLVTLVDARHRLLAPQGTMIPLRDELWGALVELPEVHRTFTAPWNAFGFDMHKIRHRVINTWRKVYVAPEDLITQPQCWAVVDYAALETPDVSGQLTWDIGSDRTSHGLAAWFDSTLVEGATFSNAPGAAELIYGCAFFPWPEPVRLESGDRVSVSLRAKLVGGDYVWSWDTAIYSKGRTKAEFRQSTFYGAVLSPDRLRKRSSAYHPRLTEEAAVERFILTLMDGEHSIEEISHKVSRQFPGFFTTFEDARVSVADLSLRWSR